MKKHTYAARFPFQGETKKVGVKASSKGSAIKLVHKKYGVPLAYIQVIEIQTRIENCEDTGSIIFSYSVKK